MIIYKFKLLYILCIFYIYTYILNTYFHTFIHLLSGILLHKCWHFLIPTYQAGQGVTVYLPCQDWLAMQRSMLEQFAAARGSAEGDNYVEVCLTGPEGRDGCSQNSQVPTNLYGCFQK